MGASNVICPLCKRNVLMGEHRDCGGDPRATCARYGCGRPAVEREMTDATGEGRWVYLGYCQFHACRTGA